MRSLGWVTILVLAAPAVALDLLPRAAEPLPEGCAEEAPGVVACTWTAEFTATGPNTLVFALPAVGAVYLDTKIESPPRTSYEWYVLQGEYAFLGYCACDADDAATSHTWFDLLVLAEGDEFRIRRASPIVGPQGLTAGGFSTPMPLTLDVSVVLTSLVPGTQRPSEPAATAADPQLLDRRGDQVGAEHLDIVAAWFDDEFLEDGLVEVHVKVADLAASLAAEPRPFYRVRWTLLGDESELDWNLCCEGNWTAHIHYRFVHGPSGPTGYEAGPSAQILSRTDLENDTLTAILPLRFIGDPDAHARFTDVTAESFDFPPANNTEQVPRPGFLDRVVGAADPGAVVRDTATDNVRPFAVGGPEVWRELRGTSAVAAPEARPWYRDPLAPENVPDTLQAVGFLGALGTACGGYLLVRRRRERMHAHIAEVDAAFALHTADPEAALKALEDLEHRFDQMMLDGKLDDKQHDVLARRIERSAYKILKLKRA